MYLFKTSGLTFDSVIANQKHAFRISPSDWHPGEIVLVSKNKIDCAQHEKQISFTMRLSQIRQTTDEEIERYWPGNAGRWKYIVDCTGTEPVPFPFDLEDVLGADTRAYAAVVTFKKIEAEHEPAILLRLNLPQTNTTDEINIPENYVEGACHRISINAYERDPVARERCIEHYSCLCQVCRFDFHERYGDLGTGFIHVHHVVPLAEIRGEYSVDPIRDLIPLCANCHAMIHRRRPALTIDELRGIFEGEN